MPPASSGDDARGCRQTASAFCPAAVVVAPGPELESPLVRVTHDTGGMPIPREDQPAIQLEAQGDLAVAEFLMVGISEEKTATASTEPLQLTNDFSEFFQ